MQVDRDGAGVVAAGVGVLHAGGGTAVGAARRVGEVVHADEAGRLGQEGLGTTKQPVVLYGVTGGDQEQDQDQGTGEAENSIVGQKPVVGNRTEGSVIFRSGMVGKDTG